MRLTKAYLFVCISKPIDGSVSVLCAQEKVYKAVLCIFFQHRGGWLLLIYYKEPEQAVPFWNTLFIYTFSERVPWSLAKNEVWWHSITACCPVSEE